MGSRRLGPLVALFTPLLALAALLGSTTATAEARDCSAWPGEPEPLPTVHDTDPARARWAHLRGSELVGRARFLEARAPAQAHLLWSRALCLDADNGEASRGLARTIPLTVHRPLVARVSEPGVLDPWAGLGAPVWPEPFRLTLPEAPHALPGPLATLEGASPAPEEPPATHADTPASAEPPPAPPRGPSPAESERVRAAVAAIDRRLAEAEDLLRRARFERALASTDAVRLELTRLPEDEGSPHRRVRLELATATARVALGQEPEARAAFARAIAADPHLSLDPQDTSPKVLRVFRAARGTRGH